MRCLTNAGKKSHDEICQLQHGTSVVLCDQCTVNICAMTINTPKGKQNMHTTPEVGSDLVYEPLFYTFPIPLHNTCAILVLLIFHALSLHFIILLMSMGSKQFWILKPSFGRILSVLSAITSQFWFSNF
jgi:hypothetical protein